jgi:hypothetical protein
VSAARADRAVWLASFFLLSSLYLIGLADRREAWFGINALRQVASPRVAAIAIAAAALAVVFALGDPLPWPRTRVGAALAAALSFPVFFLLRTNVLNADGNMLTPKFQADVPRIGAHLSHDEILELFVHSRFWSYTHDWWGWSVVFSYQVMSCVAGSLFVYGLVRLAPRLAPIRTWLFAAGAMSGVYMQLFFGDVENYTITAALVVFYVIAAVDFLNRRMRLRVPVAMLAIAMCFHLETAWLLPSSLYLLYVERSRHGRDIPISLAIAAIIGGAVLVYFHFHGLPVRRLLSSHAGHAVRMDGVFAVLMPSEYYIDQLNLFLLLCPVVVLAVAVLVSRPEPDATTTFLIVAAVSMAAMQAVWKAQLGVRDDWNLYAIGGMLSTFAIWRAVTIAASTRARRIAAALVASIACLHTYAWIASNHWR